MYIYIVLIIEITFGIESYRQRTLVSPRAHSGTHKRN